MTSDPPRSPPARSSTTSPRSSTSPSFNSQYTRAYVSPFASSSSSSTSTSPSKSKSLPPPKPAGPRSPPRDHPGSSRTKYRTSLPFHATSPTLRGGNIPDIHSMSLTSEPEADMPRGEAIGGEETMGVEAPYREPEAVIEPVEEHPPGYVPGVVAEHPVSDDDDLTALGSSPTADRKQADKAGVDEWQANLQKYGLMDVDPTDRETFRPERPQVGPGVLPRRWLTLVHEHDLSLPQINEVPVPVKKAHTAAASSIADIPPPASPQTVKPPLPERPNGPAPPSPVPSMRSQKVAPSVPDYERAYALDDVWAACPGGAAEKGEWYFCATCWGWLHVGTHRGEPVVPSMEEWEYTVQAKGRYASAQALEEARAERLKEFQHLKDVTSSRLLAPSEDHHLHEFTTLLDGGDDGTSAKRIPRVAVTDEMNAFPHFAFGEDGAPAKWTSFDEPENRKVRLFVSCSSDLWCTVDREVVPGQLPRQLVAAFTGEKMANPAPGMNGPSSVNEAWTLISTLLANPLFKRQRGWVKLDNSKFQQKIGASIASSNLLYQIGFGCRQEEDALRVGPLNPGESVTQEDVKQMDRYMLRTWVEVCLSLTSYQAKHDIQGQQPNFVFPLSLDTVLAPALSLDKRYFKSSSTLPDNSRDACHLLGVSKVDTPSTIETAYDLQVACDAQNIPKYLQALEDISRVLPSGREGMQMKVATERSLDRYTLSDLQAAYEKIGYTVEHASMLGVDAVEAPDDYILTRHREASERATNQEKAEIASALVLIGRDRGNETMKRLGGSGQTFLSVDDAYRALSAPRDAVDDGLIMQYEMAVNEYPGKIEHYRMCLDIIANAPDAERPGIKAFLETGNKDSNAPPARKDIPVGLQNIGNTCYLNSILQYLYSIKPLREAVMSFEQDSSGTKTPLQPEVERSKRFVRQLRLLFLQLYKAEQSSVRPDEELAYLAITRPEIDAIVESPSQPEPSLPTLDSIPNIPSPSSTRVATPTLSDDGNILTPTSPPPELDASDPNSRRDTILGKRASTDRDSGSSRSSVERSRHKLDGFEDLGDPSRGTDSPMELDRDAEDFEVVQRPGTEGRGRTQADSPSAVTDLAELEIQSPPNELAGPSTANETAVGYEPPSVPPPLPARPAATRKDTLASGLRFGLQQDSAEVLINVLTQLETAFDPATAEDGIKGSNLISNLFSCKFRQQLLYTAQSGTIEAQTPVESVFVHPIIGVEEEGKDLYDCLGELYLGGAEIEYEGKKGVMMDLMDEFPPMLYIQMRRSQYDMATGRERKTNTHIAFEQTLAMDRFLAGADTAKREESIRLTREMINVRSRLHHLKNHKPLSIPATFTHVHSALSTIEIPELDVSPDFLSALEKEGSDVAAEITSLEEQLPSIKRRLNGIWEGEPSEVEYELVAVFMHRGKTSGAGHYWTYQAHLPGHSDRFFKYNDEQVTEVPASEVLQDRTGSDANPALLCYVRKGRELVDTLHREVLEMVDQAERADDVGAAEVLGGEAALL